MRFNLSWTLKIHNGQLPLNIIELPNPTQKGSCNRSCGCDPKTTTNLLTFWHSKVSPPNILIQHLKNRNNYKVIYSEFCFENCTLFWSLDRLLWHGSIKIFSSTAMHQSRHWFMLGWGLDAVVVSLIIIQIDQLHPCHLFCYIYIILNCHFTEGPF